MGQGNSARDFGPSESMENAGILDVFPIFHAARLGQKIRRSPLLPLCGVALNQAILEMASFRDTSQTDNIEFSKVRSLGYYLIAEREMTGGRLLIVFERPTNMPSWQQNSAQPAFALLCAVIAHELLYPFAFN